MCPRGIVHHRLSIILIYILLMAYVDTSQVEFRSHRESLFDC